MLSAIITVLALLLIAAGCFASVASATATEPDRARRMDTLCRNISIAATVALVAFIYGVLATLA